MKFPLQFSGLAKKLSLVASVALSTSMADLKPNRISQPAFPIQCIEASMKAAGPISIATCNCSNKCPAKQCKDKEGSLKFCETNGELEDTDIKTTYQTFLYATKCLNVSPYDVFPLFNRESRFHTGRVDSTRNFFCIGQMGGPAIAEIGEWQKKNISQELKFDTIFKNPSPAPACKKLKETFHFSGENTQNYWEQLLDSPNKSDKHKVGPRQDPRCHVVDNTGFCLFASILYFKFGYLMAKNLVSKSLDLRKKNIFPEQAQERIAYAAALFAYNSGPEVLESSFKGIQEIFIGNKNLCDYKRPLSEEEVKNCNEARRSHAVPPITVSRFLTSLTQRIGEKKSGVHRRFVKDIEGDLRALDTGCGDPKGFFYLPELTEYFAPKKPGSQAPSERATR